MTILDATKPTSSDGATGSTPELAETSDKSTSTRTQTGTPAAWRVFFLGGPIPEVIMAPSREEAFAMFLRENPTAHRRIVVVEPDPRGGR